MPDWSRRSLLATLGTAALAGCLAGGGGSDDTPGDTPDATPSPTPTPTPTDARTQTPTPEDEATPEPPASVDTEWPLPAHDPGRSNYAPDATGPTDPVAELWSVSTGASLSAPVVADGTVYVGGSDGAVRALDARTGSERWQQSVGETAGAPRAVDGKLVVRSESAIVALAAADGTERWRVETKEVPIPALTAAARGVYYLAGPEDAEQVSAVARETADGSERWRATVGDPWEPTLLAGDGRVFVSTGPHNPVPWTFGAESGDLRNDRRPGKGADFPSVRFYRDGRLFGIDGFFGTLRATGVAPGADGWSQGVGKGGTYAASGGGDGVYLLHAPYEDPDVRLVCLSASSGTRRWEKGGLSGWSQPAAITGETALVATDDRLRCFDPDDGRELWSRPGTLVGDRVAVVDDLVVTVDGATVRALRPP